MNKKMYVFLSVFFLAPFFFYGCGIQVPADKAQYAGEWQSPEMYLLITQDGSVKYKRIQGGATKSVTGPLREFKGNDFVVGLPVISTTFIVSRPPYEENGQWKMIVDGVTLIRTG